VQKEWFVKIFGTLEKLFLAVTFAETGDNATAKFWVEHRGKSKNQLKHQSTDSKKKRPQLRA